MDFERFLQFFISGIGTGSIYAIVALGFMIVYSVTKVVNFSQGEFVMLGGMISVAFFKLGVPLYIAILCAVMICTLFGVFFYQVVIYPIKSAPSFSLILVTFGASIVIRGIALIIWGTDPMLLPSFTGSNSIVISKIMISPQSLWVMGTTAFLTIFLYLFFEYTLHGKAFRASSINTLGASLMGIRTDRMGALAFALAAGLGALAGAVLTPLMTTSYDIGLSLAVKGFIAALIGGLNKIEGVILGGLILGILESLGAGLIHSGFKDAIPLIIFLAILYFRRGGILGGAGAGAV